MSSIKEIRSELRYLSRELGLLDKNCLNSGLSLTQAHLLTYLQKNGSTTFSELSSQLNVEKASLSRTINGLIDKKMLTSMPCAKDKRQKYFTIRDEGIERLKQAELSANNKLSQLLELLNNKEIEDIIGGLRALRLSAFRKNAVHNKSKVQIEELRSVYRAEIDALIMDTFSHEQDIPQHLIPLPKTMTQNWWVARSGEYVIGAVACWKEDGRWHWGRFVVDSKFRGLGIGKALARYSLNQALQEIDELYIEARDTTVKIVQTLGGETLGEKIDFYGMPVTPMRISRCAHNDVTSATEKQQLSRLTIV